MTEFPSTGAWRVLPRGKAVELTKGLIGPLFTNGIWVFAMIGALTGALFKRGTPLLDAKES